MKFWKRPSSHDVIFFATVLFLLLVLATCPQTFLLGDGSTAEGANLPYERNSNQDPDDRKTPPYSLVGIKSPGYIVQVCEFVGRRAYCTDVYIKYVIGPEYRDLNYAIVPVEGNGTWKDAAKARRKAISYGEEFMDEVYERLEKEIEKERPRPSR